MVYVHLILFPSGKRRLFERQARPPFPLRGGQCAPDPRVIKTRKALLQGRSVHTKCSYPNIFIFSASGLQVAELRDRARRPQILPFFHLDSNSVMRKALASVADTIPIDQKHLPPIIDLRCGSRQDGNGVARAAQ